METNQINLFSLLLPTLTQEAMESLQCVFQDTLFQGYFDATAFDRGTFAMALQELYEAGLIRSTGEGYRIAPTEMARDLFALQHNGTVYVEPRFAFETEMVTL